MLFLCETLRILILNTWFVLFFSSPTCINEAVTVVYDLVSLGVGRRSVSLSGLELKKFGDFCSDTLKQEKQELNGLTELNT